MATTYKKLTPSEILKPGRENRGPTVVKKIKDGDPFLLYNGGTVVIKKEPHVIQLIEAGLNAKSNEVLNAIYMTGMDGKRYKLSDFAKSAEFGGLGAGSGTRAEDAALTDIKGKLEDVIKKENTPFIYVRMGNKTARVASIESTPGTPKSDFHMMDENGKMVFWISHKKGSRSYDFQQYGGMTELAPHPDIDSFVKDVKAKLADPKKFPMKTAFYRPVKSRDIALKTLFGKSYKPGLADSIQNIDVLHQGMMNFARKGEKDGIGIYEITSNHTTKHGQIPTGDYECYYYVRPEQAKTQFGIVGARFFIVAKLTATRNKNASLI